MSQKPIEHNVYAFRRPASPPASAPVEGCLNLGAAEPARSRLDLWELPTGCLCPIVGTCLPVETLRALLDALFGGSSELGDFELHAGVVRECGTRNHVSERVGCALDQRHADALQQLAGCDDEGALLNRWQAAVGSGDVAGALWAIVTHPRCSDALREQMMRDVHMAQHRYADRLHARSHAAEVLAADNRRLRRSLADSTGEGERLRAELADARAAIVAARTGRPAWLGAIAAALRPRHVIGQR